MVTLIIVGLCFLLYGWIRTFVLYAAIVATIITMGLMMIVGGGFSYLFWNEQVHAFQIGEFWCDTFTSRPGFDLWQAFFVPIIFVFDMLRVTLRFLWQCPNIIAFGVFGYWCYLMYILWGHIVLPIILPKRKSTSTNLVV